MNVLVKVAVILIISFVSSQVEAQTNFEKGMAKAFELWQSEKTDEAENMFESIAKAVPNVLFPNYYIAQINSLKSWYEKVEAVLKAQLDKAQEHIDVAMTKSEDNAELLIMQAQVLTNWVAFDGMTYGMKYGAKITELYTKALELEPTNPRAAFCKAEWEMGSAKYFGQDTAPYCKEIEASIELFDTFKPESDFYPNWGKERAVQVVESCKE
jgi:hypothetical protein